MVAKAGDLDIVVQHHLVGVLELVHVGQFPSHVIQTDLVRKGAHGIGAQLGDGKLVVHVWVAGEKDHLAAPGPVPDLQAQYLMVEILGTLGVPDPDHQMSQPIELNHGITSISWRSMYPILPPFLPFPATQPTFL